MKKIITLFALLFLSYSCSNDDHFAVIPELPANIYVAGVGSEIQAEMGRAVLWKNGIATFLSSPAEEGIANSVAVKNGDVHVVGQVQNANLIKEARYWKNGVPQNLGINVLTNSNAVSVCIYNNDVYVLGYDNGVVKYWKNGVVNTVTGFTTASPWAIAVSNGVVYIGVTESGSVKVWKNGVITTLSDGIKTDLLTGMCVKGNDVYVLAEERYNSEVKIKYWKNGTLTYIPAPSNAIRAYAISVLNNDVYVGGTQDDKAMYWKNGTPIILNTPGSTYSAIWALTAFKGKLYGAGVANGKLETWKSQKRMNTNSTSFNDDPYSIFVTE